MADPTGTMTHNHINDCPSCGVDEDTECPREEIGKPCQMPGTDQFEPEYIAIVTASGENV